MTSDFALLDVSDSSDGKTNNCSIAIVETLSYSKDLAIVRRMASSMKSFRVLVLQVKQLYSLVGIIPVSTMFTNENEHFLTVLVLQVDSPLSKDKRSSVMNDIRGMIGPSALISYFQITPAISDLSSRTKPVSDLPNKFSVSTSYSKKEKTTTDVDFDDTGTRSNRDRSSRRHSRSRSPKYYRKVEKSRRRSRSKSRSKSIEVVAIERSSQDRSQTESIYSQTNSGRPTPAIIRDIAPNQSVFIPEGYSLPGLKSIKSSKRTTDPTTTSGSSMAVIDDLNMLLQELTTPPSRSSEVDSGGPRNGITLFCTKLRNEQNKFRQGMVDSILSDFCYEWQNYKETVWSITELNGWNNSFDPTFTLDLTSTNRYRCVFAMMGRRAEEYGQWPEVGIATVFAFLASCEDISPMVMSTVDVLAYPEGKPCSSMTSNEQQLQNCISNLDEGDLVKLLSALAEK